MNAPEFAMPYRKTAAQIQADIEFEQMKCLEKQWNNYCAECGFRLTHSDMTLFMDNICEVYEEVKEETGHDVSSKVAIVFEEKYLPSLPLHKDDD